MSMKPRFPVLLEKALKGPLSYEEAVEAARAVFDGVLSDAQVAALLVALKARGEKASEIAAFAGEIRRRALRPRELPRVDAVDTAGTGGDGKHTVNASTGAALVVAACGAYAAKHGNRSVSSHCGSADVLEELGVNIALKPDEAAELLVKERFTFLYAPLYHPAIGKVMPVRRALGVRTIFNLVGPLANPFMVSKQVVGVSSQELAPEIAEALSILGAERALVVHGEPGIDEVSVSGETRVILVEKSGADELKIAPEDLGLARRSLHEVVCSDKRSSALRLVRALGGVDLAARDFIAANAGAALYAAGLASDLRDGVEAALQAISEGKALAKLASIVVSSNGDPAKLKRIVEEALGVGAGEDLRRNQS